MGDTPRTRAVRGSPGALRAESFLSSIGPSCRDSSPCPPGHPGKAVPLLHTHPAGQPGRSHFRARETEAQGGVEALGPGWLFLPASSLDARPSRPGARPLSAGPGVCPPLVPGRKRPTPAPAPRSPAPGRRPPACGRATERKTSRARTCARSQAARPRARRPHRCVQTSRPAPAATAPPGLQRPRPARPRPHSPAPGAPVPRARPMGSACCSCC